MFLVEALLAAFLCTATAAASDAHHPRLHTLRTARAVVPVADLSPA